MSLGKQRGGEWENRRRGDCRPLAPSPRLPLRLDSRAFPLADRDLELFAGLLEHPALIKCASEVAVSFRVVTLAKLQRGLQLVDRICELTSTVKDQPEIVMRIRGGVTLSDCSVQGLGCAIQVTKPRKRVAEIAMRVREGAVLLSDGRLICAHRLSDLAPRIQRVTQVVMSFRVPAFPLLDRRSVSGDSVIYFAEVIKSYAEI